jgi:hypothetical protein
MSKKITQEETTAQQYLDMWLSEQIPIPDWLGILGTRKDVQKLYNEHLEKKNEKII